MTSNSSVTRILPQVRRIVLEERARSEHPTCGFGLSWLTWQLGETRSTYQWRCDNRSRFTSGGLKSVRGHAHAALAILAREGIMFGRNHPEGGVARYEHGETDKRFRVRISQAEAKKRLARMK